MGAIWEFATAFVGHDAWAILNVQTAVALYRAVLCSAMLAHGGSEDVVDPSVSVPAPR